MELGKRNCPFRTANKYQKCVGINLARNVLGLFVRTIELEPKNTQTKPIKDLNKPRCAYVL